LVEPFNGVILPPRFTSYDGDLVVRITVLSGSTHIGYSTAVDMSTPVQDLTYTMGGVNAGHITHNALTDKELSFTVPCDYYNPVDVDGNNEYNFSITASNGVYSTKQTYIVTVIVTEQFSTPEVEVKKKRKHIFLDANSDFRLNLLAVLVYDEDAIQNKLYNFLRTRKGSRFRQPDFGCALPEFIHEPCTEATASLIRLDLLQGLEKWMPEIKLQPGQSTVTVNDTYSGYEIVLHYYIPALDRVSSMSFDASKY
jgi:phage baseplate assembly protein W